MAHKHDDHHHGHNHDHAHQYYSWQYTLAASFIAVVMFLIAWYQHTH